MIVVMRTGATGEEIDEVKRTIEENGLEAFVSDGEERTVIGVVGPDVASVEHIVSLPGRRAGHPRHQAVQARQPRAPSRPDARPRRRGRRRGGSTLQIMAGPCAVESREQLLATARWVKREGATVLRGGAFKPRTSPYAFQGLGEEGLKLLAEAREETGLPVVSEITDPADVELFDRYVDMLQVGSRNMHNFVLLKAVGQSRKPVLLKRGFGATIEEWLMAAEYILSSRQPQRDPVRARHPHLRDGDPQHARPLGRARAARADPPADHGRPVARHRASARWCGRWRWPAAAVGADGIIIEVHPDPPRARPTPSSRSRSPSSAT